MSSDGTTSLVYPTIPLACNCAIVPDDAPVVFVAANVTDENQTNVYTINRVLEPSFQYTTVLTILVKQFPTLVQLGGLTYPNGLPRNESFTILAPTDEAFAKLGNETLQRLQQPENVDELTQILNNHLIDSVLPTTLVSAENGIMPRSGIKINVSGATIK